MAKGSNLFLLFCICSFCFFAHAERPIALHEKITLGDLEVLPLEVFYRVEIKTFHGWEEIDCLCLKLRLKNTSKHSTHPAPFGNLIYAESSGQKKLPAPLFNTNNSIFRYEQEILGSALSVSQLKPGKEITGLLLFRPLENNNSVVFHITFRSRNRQNYSIEIHTTRHHEENISDLSSHRGKKHYLPIDYWFKDSPELSLDKYQTVLYYQQIKLIKEYMGESPLRLQCSDEQEARRLLDLQEPQNVSQVKKARKKFLIIENTMALLAKGDLKSLAKLSIESESGNRYLLTVEGEISYRDLSILVRSFLVGDAYNKGFQWMIEPLQLDITPKPYKPSETIAWIEDGKKMPDTSKSLPLVRIKWHFRILGYKTKSTIVPGSRRWLEIIHNINNVYLEAQRYILKNHKQNIFFSGLTIKQNSDKEFIWEKTDRQLEITCSLKHNLFTDYGTSRDILQRLLERPLKKAKNKQKNLLYSNVFLFFEVDALDKKCRSIIHLTAATENQIFREDSLQALAGPDQTAWYQPGQVIYKSKKSRPWIFAPKNLRATTKEQSILLSWTPPRSKPGRRSATVSGYILFKNWQKNGKKYQEAIDIENYLTNYTDLHIQLTMEYKYQLCAYSEERDIMGGISFPESSIQGFIPSARTLTKIDRDRTSIEAWLKTIVLSDLSAFVQVYVKPIGKIQILGLSNKSAFLRISYLAEKKWKTETIMVGEGQTIKTRSFDPGWTLKKVIWRKKVDQGNSKFSYISAIEYIDERGNTVTLYKE